MKTILSLSDSASGKNIKISKAEPCLSDYEKKVLYRYIFPYRYNYSEQFAYLEQGDAVHFLNPETNYGLHKVAGPVNPGSYHFQLIDNFSLNFSHEPMYEYEFLPKLLKMRSMDREKNYPDYLWQYPARRNYRNRCLQRPIFSGNIKNILT